VENAGNGQHNDTDGNLNTSNVTPSKGSDISNKHTLKMKRQNTKKNNKSESDNINHGRKVSKNTEIYSDSEEEEINLSSLAQAGEYPDPESSISSGTTRNKVRNVILDSDSESDEISLSSLFWKDDIPGTKRSETHGSSNKTTDNKLRSIVSDSDSENEEIAAKAQKTNDNPCRVACALDSDVDTLHSNRRNKDIFSVDEANTMGTKKRHLDEEIKDNTDMQKRCKVALSDDEED
jgi:hypothetical protein